MLLLFLQLLLVLENLKNHAEYRSEESKEIKQPDHLNLSIESRLGKCLEFFLNRISHHAGCRSEEVLDLSVMGLRADKDRMGPGKKWYSMEWRFLLQK